jgi:small subunit ribosomal protein S13
MIYMGIYKISVKKPITVALPNIYGIGYSRANLLRRVRGAHPLQTLRHTTKIQRKFWMHTLKKTFLLGSLLKQLKRTNIKRLKYIKCNRGLRHSWFLPTRGQRTHSNHRTSRYLMSGTWQCVPTGPAVKFKKVSKYVRHKAFLVEGSNAAYHKLLQRNFTLLQKNKRYFKQLTRQGKLAQFAKLAKQKTKSKKTKK